MVKRSAPLPAEISIMGQTFRVRGIGPEESPFRGAEHGVTGATNLDQMTIITRLAATGDLNVHQERDTVLHETLHGLTYLLAIENAVKADLAAEDPNLEQTVRVLSTGLLHVLRANPELVKYLMDGVE
jgi:hypothetical protein